MVDDMEQYSSEEKMRRAISPLSSAIRDAVLDHVNELLLEIHELSLLRDRSEEEHR